MVEERKLDIGVNYAGNQRTVYLKSMYNAGDIELLRQTAREMGCLITDDAGVLQGYVDRDNQSLVSSARSIAQCSIDYADKKIEDCRRELENIRYEKSHPRMSGDWRVREINSSISSKNRELERYIDEKRQLIKKMEQEVERRASRRWTDLW